ncbi:MAG: hypothetical protein ACJ72W_08270, partial [Actinoallomurus sp.]
VSGVAGDVPRLAEHGVFLAAFGGLLAAAYRWSGAARGAGGPGAPAAMVPEPPRPALVPAAAPPVRPNVDATRQDLTVRKPEAHGEDAGGGTRSKVGGSASDVTHRDLARSTSDTTHRDVGVPDLRDVHVPENRTTDREVAEPASDTTRQDIRVRKGGPADGGGMTRKDIPIRPRHTEPTADDNDAEIDETMLDGDR